MRTVQIFDILNYYRLYNLYSHAAVLYLDVALFFLYPSLKLLIFHCVMH